MEGTDKTVKVIKYHASFISNWVYILYAERKKKVENQTKGIVRDTRLLWSHNLRANLPIFSNISNNLLEKFGI